MMAVVLALILALARPARGQVAETIPEADEEVEVFETAGDDFALTPDFAADPAPVFSEPARADRRMASPGLYSAEPDIARCEPGTLRNDARANFVNALNAERARHGLAPVAYDAAWDREVAAAALIMAANTSLSHAPPSSWRCWTASGARGAGSSNLLLNTASGDSAPADDADLVAQWMIEGGGDELGHRRWILDPYLTRTALGRVAQIFPDGSLIDSAVMKVFDFSGDDPLPAQLPEFIAWPQGVYPRNQFSPNARLSFTVVTGRPGTGDAAAVDFSRAQVTVSDSGSPLAVSAIADDNEDYGMANCLSWRVAGLQTGRRYDVTISGIRGAPRERYTYTFRITD
jgi:uncharacterized protein YkwD